MGFGMFSVGSMADEYKFIGDQLTFRIKMCYNESDAKMGKEKRMGRFSTTVQIKSNADRMRFLNSFCDVMKKRGFVPCSEDEAALSYLLAFGEGGWGTLTSEEYKNNPQKAYDDSRQMAETLKTSAFSVEVIDSDFALLKLCNSDGGEDKVVVGDGSGYGVDNAGGTRELWESLLTDGKTWEQFSETAAKNEVFVEDALAELAEVLGMEPYDICTDFDEVLNRADENENITAFYFKKAAAKAKSMSLNAAFVKVFGEALEPLGFKKIKSKYPYFVRVVPGGEIIHIITYMEEWCPYPGRKKFNILGGIATVYRHKIDLSLAPKVNSFWLYSIARFYSRITPESELDNEYRLSICHFSLEENREASMLNALKYSLELTNKFILPQLNTAVDIESSLIYLSRLGQLCGTSNFNSNLNFGASGDYDEGFLYVKADDDGLKSRLEKIIDGTIPSSEEGRQKAVENYKFLNDPVIHEKVLLELERRKAANTEILRSYGMDV